MQQVTPAAEGDAEQLLESLIHMMVDRPQDVRIERHIGEATATFEIYVHDSDVGKVLGKKGFHTKALRTLFTAIYGKLGKRLHLTVIDPRIRR